MRAKRILPLIAMLFVAALTVTLAVRAQQNEWTPVPTNLSVTPQISDLTFDNNNCMVVSDRVSQFARSCDGGQTWARYASGIPSTCMAWTVEKNPTNGDLIGVLNDTGDLGQNCGATRATYWRLPSGSSQWLQIPQPAGFFTHGGAMGHSVAFSGNQLAIGGTGCNGCVLMYSTDGGKTTHLSKSVSGAVRSMFSPSPGHFGYGTENNGYFESADGGQTYNHVWNLISGSPSNGEGFPAMNCNGNIVFGSISGVWMSTGSYPNYSWTFVHHDSARTRGVFVDPACGVYLGQAQRSWGNPTVQRSTDGGAAWSDYYTGIPCCREAWHFVYNPVDHKDYVVVENGQGNQGLLFVTANRVN